MEKVLVVDDEANILKLVSVNLQIRGYEVLQAKTAAEALETLHSIQPSLMILDIRLPDFSGWELLKQIENDPLITPDFPVLIITASMAEAFVDAETYPDVREVITKPFNTARLISAVERTLSAH